MKIFAIGDLHLSHAGEKPMDIFGPHWKDHHLQIAANWKEKVTEKDLVLIPGDLSWAMHLQEAKADLEWIDQLPGRKILLKGNHDYWWSSITQLRNLLKGSSLFPIQYDAATFGQVTIGGTRLWTTPDAGIVYPDPLKESQGSDADAVLIKGQEEKVFKRELGRLEASLSALSSEAVLRIAMTHFPPTNESGKDTILTQILEKHNIDICVFGHLHSLNLPEGMTWDYVKNSVRYVLVSCDAIDFVPYFLQEIPDPPSR